MIIYFFNNVKKEHLLSGYADVTGRRYLQSSISESLQWADGNDDIGFAYMGF